jgi:2-succinyl-5-enolpyruvyl-6-hydroxy-3-cyclohexene-1-carboxylate synthase
MMAEPANPSTAMATTLVDELARNGVTDVVVSPGSRSTALAIAAVRHPGLAVHVRHDERSAGFLALGLARVSSRPAVVVTTSGTAVANLVPAVAEADASGIPLVVLSADRPVELHDVGANQTLAQAALFGRLARWQVDLPAASGVVGEPDLWRSTACRVVATARGVGGGQAAQAGTGGPAGPVHCNVAFREPTVPALDDGRSVAAPYPHPVTGRRGGRPWTEYRAGATDVDGLVEELLAAWGDARVVVVAGDTPHPVVGLDDLSWPVVAEPTAGPTAVAGIPHGSLLVGSAAWRGQHRPDVVLRLGHPTLAQGALAQLGEVATVQVTESGVVDPARQATHAVTAAPNAFVAALGRALAARPGHHARVTEWREAWQAAGTRAREVVTAHLDGPDAPEPAVARRVVTATGTRPLVVASSLPIRDVADFAAPAADGTGRVHANRGLAGIDGFVSTAVGVALAAGPTVALAGDLSFLHDHNGLLVPDAAAVDLDLVIVDNDGGGLFHHVPAVQVPEFEHVFATPHGRDLVAVARAAGVAAEAVGIDEVAGALARPPAGLRVVVVRTDRRAGAAARNAIRHELDHALSSGSARGA